MIDTGFIDTSTTDYWYDVGCGDSEKTLAGFSSDEWSELLDLWLSQPEEWQARLAYILGNHNSQREAALLLQMYQKGSENIALSAAESIRGMLFEIVSSAYESLPIVSENARLSTYKNTNELLALLWMTR